MPFETMIGFTAGALTTFAFLPQVVKTWRSQSSADLSLGMYGILTSGVLCWLIYGLLLGDLPIIVTNSIGLALQISVLTLIIRHRIRDRRAA